MLKADQFERNGRQSTVIARVPKFHRSGAILIRNPIEWKLLCSSIRYAVAKLRKETTRPACPVLRQ